MTISQKMEMKRKACRGNEAVELNALCQEEKLSTKQEARLIDLAENLGVEPRAIDRMIELYAEIRRLNSLRDGAASVHAECKRLSAEHEAFTVETERIARERKSRGDALRNELRRVGLLDTESQHACAQISSAQGEVDNIIAASASGMSLEEFRAAKRMERDAAQERACAGTMTIGLPRGEADADADAPAPAPRDSLAGLDRL